MDRFVVAEPFESVYRDNRLLMTMMALLVEMQTSFPTDRSIKALTLNLCNSDLFSSSVQQWLASSNFFFGLSIEKHLISNCRSFSACMLNFSERMDRTEYSKREQQPVALTVVRNRSVKKCRCVDYR